MSKSFREWIKHQNNLPGKVKLDDATIITNVPLFLETHISIAEHLLSLDKKYLANRYIDRLVRFRKVIESKKYS